MAKRGGKREGAGRKPGKHWNGTGDYRNRIRVNFSFTAENVEQIRAEADARGVSQSQIANEAVAFYLNRDVPFMYRDTLEEICSEFDVGIVWGETDDGGQAVCWLGENEDDNVAVPPVRLTPTFESEVKLRHYINSVQGQHELSERIEELYPNWDAENRQWRE